LAARTPTARGTAGYVQPKLGVFGVGSTASTSTNNLLTDVNNPRSNRNGLHLSIIHFADVDNAETWTSEIKGAVACAWQGEDATDDDGAVFITVAAAGGRSRSGSVFQFQMENSTSAGWLWVLHAS